MLVDATDLSSWANRHDARFVLPQLLRRLVHATVERVLRAGFRAGEGVQLGGWDGIVVVEQGNAFVPDGTSVWELSTDQNIKGKVDEDYEKRRKDPRGIDPAKSTFLFVTPRRWGDKEGWVAARKGEGAWREVRVYDADDLEQWLELAPSVRVWLSILLGKHPEGASDLESFWEDWSATTRPATPPEFVLSGRGDVVENVRAWLRDPSTPLALQGESRDEALAVFMSVLQQLPVDERVACLARALVVYDLSAWNRLTASHQPLILVPVFDGCDEIAIARGSRKGHRIVVPLGHADETSTNTVKVPRLSREVAAKVLTAAGIDEDRARDLANLARRSLTSFRRRLALSPEMQKPKWTSPAEARSLVPAILAGAWSDAKEGDRQVLAALALAEYEEVNRTLVRWSNDADPAIRRVGDTWFVISREDAWSLLARHLTRDDLQRFEEVVIEVLGTPDPRFDLPEEKRWMAGVLGHPPRHSNFLHEGFADTLAIMGARGDTTQISSGVTIRDYTMRIVRRLLERANAAWRVWASLERSLSLIAEAAPDAFLSAVEEGLQGDQPILLNLFTDKTDKQNTLFSSSPHTGLLWALETLAWSPEYLGHAALLLAKLARLDPGGELSNRPQSSLRGVFLLWHPQTSASLDQRMRILDMLREREPEVAWRLLSQLLPRGHGVAFNTVTARWREWVPDPSQPVTTGEYIKGVREVVKRMLDDVKEDGVCWQELIEALPELPADQYEVIVERLVNMNVDRLESLDRFAIWNALRKLISHHRSFSDAGWALPEERVNRLDEVFRRFEPQEPNARYGWLFDSSPALPEGREGDWKAHQEVVVNARLDAVRTIYTQAGLAGVLELVGHVEQPSEPGVTLGRSELASREEDELLLVHLAADDAARSQFARGFAFGRVLSHGREWTEAKFADVAKAWSPAQRAELLACLPNDGRTWDNAERTDPETEHRYWRLVRPYGIDKTDVERAARKLLEHGRPYTAVDLLALHVGREQTLSAGLIADALECVLRASPNDDPPDNSFSHDLSELLDVLAASKEIDESRLARLEWAFLPILGRYERKPQLLHCELARNPDFFAEIVAMVFRAEGKERREVSTEEQARARRGYELLESWRTVPGTADDGTMNGKTLQDWVRRAREATAASGHRVLGDQMIGQVLSGAPDDTDGTWPHSTVRHVIEDVASSELEHGFEIGARNSRGFVERSLNEGGLQERQLAERYAGFASAVGDRWPRTAAMLRQIVDSYSMEARQEDERAELREELGS